MSSWEDDYEPQLHWEFHKPYHGYRGTPVTPADDFAVPYTPSTEELLEELI